MQVRAHIASIHINDVMLAIIAPRQPALQSVGWLTPNGFGNIIMWRQYSVSSRHVRRGRIGSFCVIRQNNVEEVIQSSYQSIL